MGVKKSDFVDILTCLLRPVRGKVGDDRVRFVNFDCAAEFVVESALKVYRALKLAFSVNCRNQTRQIKVGTDASELRQNQ